MNRDHAVVIGGSISGLLAARVLTDHFDRVTLIERDRYPAEAAYRPGISQSRHLHILWTRGIEIMEELFPGLEQMLVDAGAPELGVPSDILWLTAAGWRNRFDVTQLLSFSRPLLDWAVRTRLVEDAAKGPSSLNLLEGNEVVDLIPKGTDVAGVELRSGESIMADLVVDTTGRSSRASAWLAGLGYPEPTVTRVDPLLGYASRFYAIPAGFDPGWKALYLQADPPATRRAGGLFPQEGNRWLCSVSGAGRDYGPTEEAAFLDFAKTLRDPVLYETVRDAKPLSPITGYRRTANHWRHYERLPAWPRGFVVMGDAVCSFNPIYGQGMSVAAIAALALDGSLHEAADDMERRIQRRVARSGSGAWLISTGEDLRYRETEAPPTRMRTRLVNAYVDRVVAAANVNRRVCASLLDVLALSSEPASLFRPAVLARVAASRIRHGSRPAGDGAPDRPASIGTRPAPL